MDFDSLTEFPPLSQVMSPSDFPAPPGIGEWSYRVGAFPAIVNDRDKRARPAGSEGELGGATPQHAPWPPGVADKQASATAAKIKMRLRPLDTGRPELYDGWRYAAKAEIVSAGPDASKVLEYLRAIESSDVLSDEGLEEGIRKDAELRILDAKLFSALLSCLGGARQSAVEERLRGQVPFAAGGLALRCLDTVFRKGQESRAHAATRELLNLQPAGRGVAELDQFFSRYRLLEQQAGAGVGTYARTEILQRAAQQHPRLAIAWAAWRQAGAVDPSDLLRRLEESVAEGMNAGARGAGAAWAAIGCGWQYDGDLGNADAAAAPSSILAGTPSAELAQRGPQAGARMAAAHAAAFTPPAHDGATGPECWSCGKRGHLERGCPEKRKGKGSGRDGDAALHERMDKLESMIRGLTDRIDGGRSKK